MAYAEYAVGLSHSNAFELLISTILSAQCTDARVNQITPGLFNKYSKPVDFLLAPQEELEADIRPTGYYRNKARNIINCCKVLLDEFRGQVPDNEVDLLQLPGVGRKTAACVLSNWYNIPAITVDTHVLRISNRLGLVKSTNAERTQLLLMEAVPKERWNELNHLFITHGRRTCTARRPHCHDCAIEFMCPSSQLAWQTSNTISLSK